MTKRQHFMINEETDRMLRELSRQKGLNMSDLVRRAIELLYKAETKNK